MIVELPASRFPGLRADWDRMGAQPHLFVTADWLSCWLGSYRDDSHRLVLDRDGRGLAAGALMSVSGGVYRADLAETAWSGIAHRPEHARPYAGMFTHLARQRGFERIELWRVPVEEGAVIDANCGNGYQRIERHPRPGHGVDLAPTFDEYLATRAKKVRSELRRKDRNFDKAVTSSSLRTIVDPAAAFTVIETVEADSWKDAEQTSITATERDASFYRGVLNFARPDLHTRLHVLEAAGEPVAYVLCTVYREVAYALKTSFRQDWAELSPGSVLFTRLLRQLHDDREIRRLEFLGTDAPWKRQLATFSRELCNHELVPLSLRGRARAFAFQYVRPIIKNNPRLNGFYVAVRRRFPMDSQ